MSLKTQLLSQLDGLGSPSTGPHLLGASDASVTAQCEVVAVDRLALAFDHFTVLHAPLAGAGLPRLQRVAQALAGRLTYLLEDITPVEVDSEGVRIQLRSSPPAQDGTTIRYYELLLRSDDGSITLARYEAIRGQPGRSRVASEVTREVFGRLADDLTGPLAPAA